MLAYNYTCEQKISYMWNNQSIVLIQDIKDIIASRNYAIQHTLREGNHCTDYMAKLGASSDSNFLLYSSAPQDLIDMIELDAMGTSFPRLWASLSFFIFLFLFD